MTIRLRTAFIILVGIIILWFLYIERAILIPFILAAIFAYIFNPVVGFFSNKIRIPRVISVILIYLIILISLTFLGIFLARQITSESSELKSFIDRLPEETNAQIEALPDWLKSPVQETILAFKKSRIFSFSYIFSLFPAAISRIVSFFIFLFSGFYFLKEGKNIFDRLLHFVPNDYRIEIEILLRKINNVLGRYLRGQLFLVFFVSFVLFIALSILGIKFALILAIFSGFAEIIPIIGPVLAGAVAVLVVLITGQISFGLTPLWGAAVVALVYFVARMIEDYFVIPHVMGRITKLHPLLILFAVLAGGHIAGILGIILAVPIAAAIRIILEAFADKVNERSRPARRY